MEKVVFGLCEGRHEIEGVSKYIFPVGFFEEPNSMFDFERSARRILDCIPERAEVVIFVTGLTAALCSVINFCAINHLPLTVMHYDRESGEYVPQEIGTDTDFDLLKEGGYY